MKTRGRFAFQGKLLARDFLSALILLGLGLEGWTDDQAL